MPRTIQGNFPKFKVDSIADMLLLNAKEKDIAFVTGYYAIDDGGGGEFYFDSASVEVVNGGTIFGTGTGRWKRIVEGRINGKFFGAKGDGAGHDDTSFIQAAITYIASNGGALFYPEGDYYVTSTITIPEISGPFFSEEGVTVEGEHRTKTRFFTDQDITVFIQPDYTIFKNFTVNQFGTTGTGVAFFSSEQIRFCTWEGVDVQNMEYGFLFRFTLWLAFRDVYVTGTTCGFRFARVGTNKATMTDQTNPSSIASWNTSTGWFNNQLSFDNVLCNGGEVGIWGSMMGASINNVTCQNQLTDGTSNDVLPTSQKGTGIWIEGGGTATDTFNNVITNYYVEDTLNPLVVKEHDSLVVNGWFVQGITGGVSMLDIDSSSITISGQTGQSAGFTNRILGNDSKICSSGVLVASGASDNLTNCKLTESGTFPTTIKTYTPTATPSGSGTITLDTTADLLAYERLGTTVTVTGRIDVDSVSSPTGTYITISGLPYTVAALTERAGNGSGSCVYFPLSTATLLPILFIENATDFRIYVNAATIIVGDELYVTLTYLTDE